MSDESRPARAAPMLLVLSGIWGGSFLFIKVAVEDTGPLEVVTARLTLAAIVAGLYVGLIRREWIRLTPMLVGQVAVLGLIANVAPFALITWGEEHIDSGRASVLNAATPIFAAAVAAALLEEERFTVARFIGLAFGFIGVGVLTGTESLDPTDANVAGQLAVVAAAFCYGVAAVFSRNMLRTHDPISLASLQFPLGALMIGSVMFVGTGGSPDYSLDLEAWASLLALGALGTGVAYIMYLWLIENIGSVRASLVTYIVPVLAL
jgi:drug/metabolite transporter (DMT)-like permease